MMLIRYDMMYDVNFWFEFLFLWLVCGCVVLSHRNILDACLCLMFNVLLMLLLLYSSPGTVRI